MLRKGFISNKLRPWIEARTKYGLTHAQIQMARELGMNPKKFGSFLYPYFSHSGNNEKLALYIKEKFNYEIRKITELKKRKTISILFDLLFGAVKLQLLYESF